MEIRTIVFFRKILIPVLSVIFLLSGFVDTYAALVINPAFIRLKLNEKRNTGTFVLKNTGDEEVRYRAKSVYFTLTSQGGLKEVAPDEYSLATWIKFNPQEFVLPPKTSRVVRFSIIPQGKLRPYEYRGAIEFIPLKLGQIKSQHAQGHSFDIKVVSIVLVPIYGQVKGTKYSGQLKQVKINKQDASLSPTVTIVNSGDGVLNLDGMCQIVNSQGEVAEEISFKKVVIFPKSDRILKTTLKTTLKPDKYLARFNFQSNQQGVDIELKDEAKFEL